MNDNILSLSRGRSPDFAPVNMLGRSVSMRVFIPTGGLSTINEINIRVSSDVGSALNYHTFRAFPPDEVVENLWQRLEFRVHADEAASSQGTPDLRKIVELRIGFRISTPDGTSVAYFDDVRVVNTSTNCRIISMEKAFESNTWDIRAVEVPEFGLRT